VRRILALWQAVGGAIALATLAGTAAAQLQVTRGLMGSAPVTTSSARGLLSRFDFWADLQHSGSRDPAATAWNDRLGDVVNMWQDGDAGEGSNAVELGSGRGARAKVGGTFVAREKALDDAISREPHRIVGFPVRLPIRNGGVS
jgi:hypothetical protein